MIIYKGENIIVHKDSDIEGDTVYGLTFIHHSVCIYITEVVFDELTTKLQKQINKTSKKERKDVRRNA